MYKPHTKDRLTQTKFVLTNFVGYHFHGFFLQFVFHWLVIHNVGHLIEQIGAGRAARIAQIEYFSGEIP